MFASDDESPRKSVILGISWSEGQGSYIVKSLFWKISSWDPQGSWEPILQIPGYKDLQELVKLGIRNLMFL